MILHTESELVVQAALVGYCSRELKRNSKVVCSFVRHEKDAPP